MKYFAASDGPKEDYQLISQLSREIFVGEEVDIHSPIREP